MNLTSVIDLLEGKEDGDKTPQKVKAKKGKVRVFDTIKAALQSSAGYGSMFSTKAAGRIYVITHKKWGKDKESQVGTKVAKGFTPGSATPSAAWPSIKSHAKRIKAKYGQETSKQSREKYGPGREVPSTAKARRKSKGKR